MDAQQTPGSPPDRLMRGLKIGVLVSAIVLLLAGAGVVAYVGRNMITVTSSLSSGSSDDKSLNVGDVVVIVKGKPVVAAKTAEALRAESNGETQPDAILTGGTRVKVEVDRPDSTQVEVLDGPHKGSKLWINPMDSETSTLTP